MTRIKDLPQESISPSGNDWLLVDEIASDSTKKIRLSTISAQAPVQSVAGKTGVVGLTKDDVGLGNVEDTTLSTWAGSSNITTIGTLVAGTVPVARISGLAASATTDTTNATNISSGTLAAARLPSVNIGTTLVDLTRASGSLSLMGVSIDGNAGTVSNGVYTTGSYSDPTWLTISKSKVGLGNVENTALSTWGGSTNITTLGTIATGTVPWANVGSKPTTISGFGITDAPTLTGTNTLSGANTITIAAGSAAAPSLYPTGDSNTGIYSPGADQLAVTTGGTQRLTVDASGNVGIGTASPQSRLDISGTNATTSLIRVATTATSDAGVSTISTLGHYRFGTGIGSATNCWNVYDINAGTERLRIDSSGNLGLGVVPSAWWSGRKGIQIGGSGSPADAHLVSSPGAANFLELGSNFYVNSTPASVYLNNGAATAYIQDNGRHLWCAAPSGTAGNAISFSQVMTLDASGNLGIGTASPTNLLDVNANSIRVRSSRTPASATDSGNAGEICWDSNYVYVCVAANTWRRAALSSW